MTKTYGDFPDQLGQRMHVLVYSKMHELRQDDGYTKDMRLRLETTYESPLNQDNSKTQELDGVHDAVGVESELVQVDRNKARRPSGGCDEQAPLPDPNPTTPKPNFVKAKIDDINFIEVITND